MRKFVVGFVALAFITACSDQPDPAKHENLIKPTYAPEANTVTTSTVVGSVSSTHAPTTASDPATTTPTAAGGATTETAITDPANDTTPALTEQPPAWADLLGARLIRRPDGFELRVRLRGGSAPQRTDADHTMNLASFYDVDGDGNIDYEVWANVADTGWGSSYFDDVHTRARFQKESGVRVTPEGDEVVLRFPLSHLADASHFRWSLATEWGRYEVLGTLASVRDQAPDNDGAAPFPPS